MTGFEINVQSIKIGSFNKTGMALYRKILCAIGVCTNFHMTIYVTKYMWQHTYGNWKRNTNYSLIKIVR